MTRRHSALDGQDGHHLEGEFLTIRERIVVAPHWGRVHQDVTDPEPVDEGVVIGRIRERGVETPLVPPEPSVLIRWLVRDGERVAPGSPIVLLLSLDGNE